MPDLPDVEPELRHPPPRPAVWVLPSRDIPEPTLDLLVSGIATRARVTRADVGWESGYEPGPTYKVTYRYTHAGKAYTRKWGASYDGMHLAMGAPDYCSWLDSAMVTGGSFTVLYTPRKPGSPTIYGTLELYLPKTLEQSVEEYVSSPTDAHAALVLKLILAPLGRCQSHYKEYFALLGKMGMYDSRKDRVPDYDKNLEVVKSTIPSGRYDRNVLRKLSDLCFLYSPGVWAAR